MGKVAVVYWSQTGNTQAMAEAIATAAGTEATDVADFSAADVAAFDALAFGCPAMGDEELDPDFQATWEECLPALEGKKVALFGSYDWGTGEWMDAWKASAEEAGVEVVDTLIANLEPDEEALTACEALGRSLAQ